MCIVKEPVLIKLLARTTEARGESEMGLQALMAEELGFNAESYAESLEMMLKKHEN